MTLCIHLRSFLLLHPFPMASINLQLHLLMLFLHDFMTFCNTVLVICEDYPICAESISSVTASFTRLQ